MSCYTGAMASVAFNCASSHDSMLSKVYIANRDDVAITIDPTTMLATVTAKHGSTIKIYEVQVIKTSAGVASDIKINEKMYNLSTHTATLTVWESDAASLATIQAVKNGRWAIFSEGRNGAKLVHGGLAGLECSAAPNDSNADGGATTLTLSTPETSTGDMVGLLEESQWEVIVNAAGATKLTTVIDGVDFGS